MKINKIGAKSVLDSRKQKTIQVIVGTDKGDFKTSAPAGKSTGQYEVKSYAENLAGDIEFIKKIDVKEINIENFEDLNKIEKLVGKNIGGNSLFALEASLLKALAKENGKELYEFIIQTSSESSDSEDSKFAAKIKKTLKMPRPIGNTIGGGLHSKGKGGKKPDFQEFLFIANGKTFKESFEINNKAYSLAGKLLGFFKKRNDEGAFETDKTNEEVLEIMEKVKRDIHDKCNQEVDIGLDVASSSFYSDSRYLYKNISKELGRNDQIAYMSKIIKRYNMFYMEDPFEENDFRSFAELIYETKGRNCLVVGDDLTTTNPERFEKAIRMRSINAIIVKPNQIGSLLKVKQVIEIAKKNNIKTIISHRSGETMDNTIADLAVGFGCDFIKTGIYGKVREVKLKRLIAIEKKLRR
jgi:enolase